MARLGSRDAESSYVYAEQHSLFRVVGQISEYSRIKSVLNTIAAMNDDAVFPRLYKFII